MLTPFQKSALSTPARWDYNYVQSRARRCVEQSFGILKKQWRLLDMLTEHRKSQKIADTHCCVVLHNLSIRFRQSAAVPAALRAEMDVYYAQILDEVNLELSLKPPTRAQAHLALDTVPGNERREEAVRQVALLPACYRR